MAIVNAAERLRILDALVRQIRTDVTAHGQPSQHLLVALAAHASAWASEVAA